MTGLFLRAKKLLREVPGLSDQQVLASLGFNQTVVSWGSAPGTPLDVVAQARKDLEADAAGDLA
jgi:hypothetical protein